jgi:hypothetical protein
MRCPSTISLGAVRHTLFGREVRLIVYLGGGAAYPALLLGPLALPALAHVPALVLAVLVLLAARLVGALLLFLGLFALASSALPLVHADLLDCVLVNGALLDGHVAGVEVAELLVQLVVVQRI